MGATINNEATTKNTALERSAECIWGGEFKLILLPNIRPRYCGVESEKKMLSPCGGLSNVSTQGDDQIYKHTVMKQRKGFSESELKKNSS